jgi:hypothetical protein
MAFTVMGMSPWPVMKMMGTANVGLGKLGLEVEAAQYPAGGHRAQAAGMSGVVRRKNSPARLDRFHTQSHRGKQVCRASRTGGIVIDDEHDGGWLTSMRHHDLLAVCGERKFKDGPPGMARRRPQAPSMRST